MAFQLEEIHSFKGFFFVLKNESFNSFKRKLNFRTHPPPRSTITSDNQKQLCCSPSTYIMLVNVCHTFQFELSYFSDQ